MPANSSDSSTGGMFKTVSRLPQFDKDLKKLMKRFQSLEDDLGVFIKTPLKLFHRNGLNTADIYNISDLGIITPKIYKAKKFACRSLKGKGSQSGIRVIYAYKEDADEIVFIEMYFKGDKELEDRKRIEDEFGG